MPAASRLPLVLAPDGLRQQHQAGDVLYLGVFSVTTLPTGPTILQGSLAYAKDGRALIGGLLSSLTFQATGAGTGCLVTYTGNVWQVAGTNSTVTA